MTYEELAEVRKFYNGLITIGISVVLANTYIQWQHPLTNEWLPVITVGKQPPFWSEHLNYRVNPTKRIA